MTPASPGPAPRRLSALSSLTVAIGVSLLGAAGLGACAGSTSGAGSAPRAASRPNGQWTTLFANQSLAGWHNFATPGKPAAGWSFEDGLLVRSGQGGDLTSDKDYTNFELELEWRVPPGGNSGVIYRIDRKADTTWSYRTGPEMQILDDERHPDGKNPLTAAGSNYALNEAPRGAVKPANEWNSARLIVNGSHVEHWLNGTKMVSYELGSPDWEARRAKSKFANAPFYGRAKTGQIALQDHGNKVAFRNIRIKELP